jgi:hypothetical protein
MKLNKHHLKEIIREEVERHIILRLIEEELDSSGIVLTEEEKESLMKRLGKSARQNAFGLGVAGALAGVGVPTYTAVSQADQDRTTASAERKAQNIAAAHTDERQLKDFARQLNNRYRYFWGKGNAAHVEMPGTDGKVTVLPPSYSIAVQAFLDKKANAQRMEQGLPPILRYGEIDYDNLRPADTEYVGDFEQNVDMFLDEYSGDMINAMAILKAVPELKIVAGSGTEEAIAMVNPGSISSDYYLPEQGMTAQQYYDSQYGGFMGDQERAAIEDTASEEMVVTPEGDQIAPGLIKNTADIAAQLQK